MSGHHDPRLLYSISGIRAFYLQNGEEQPLTPSGAQTLSLLMVPTNSPFADLSSTQGTDTAAPEEDFYLHLNLPPELDLPLPATTQIYHQPPRSYLIPRWDLGPDSGAFTRIEFPSIGPGPDRCSQEDIDTFETILAQCTAFLERAQPPAGKSAYAPEKGGLPAFSEKGYNPANYKPGEGYAHGTGSSSHGHIVLVDEENGSVMGEMSQEPQYIDDSKIQPGMKDPVEIQISPDGKKIVVAPISDEYLRMANHPAYAKSSIVQNAAAASRLIVTGSSYLSNIMTSGAEGFTTRTKPAAKPMTFTETAHARVRKINSATTSIAGASAKTVGKVTEYAQNMSAKMVGKDQERRAKSGKEPKPGIMNKSMIAFSTVMDGIATSGKHLLTSGGAAASTVVGHRWGPEAGSMAAQLAGGVKNVGLVYIDVTGVSRRAIIKSVAKGMIVGKVKTKDGETADIVVGGGDGGEIPVNDLHKGDAKGSITNTGNFAPGGAPSVVGFGNAAPPSYNGSMSSVGENIAGSRVKGGYPDEKSGGPQWR